MVGAWRFVSLSQHFSPAELLRSEAEVGTVSFLFQALTFIGDDWGQQAIEGITQLYGLAFILMFHGSGTSACTAHLGPHQGHQVMVEALAAPGGPHSINNPAPKDPERDDPRGRLKNLARVNRIFWMRCWFASARGKPAPMHVTGSKTTGTKKPTIRSVFSGSWCPEGDSNSHSFRKRILNPPRLPIPPSGLVAPQYREVPWVGQSAFMVNFHALG